MDNGADVAAFFAQVSRELLDEPEEQPTLQRIVDRAVEVVRSSHASTISVRRRRGRVATIAVSSPEVGALDTWQVELGGGPCLEAISGQEPCHVADVARDPRWADWAARVAKAGVGSALSVPLTDESGTFGALSLYARRAHAFDAATVDRALIFGSHAATALSAARLVSGLQTAVESRHLIGIAQGILMQRYDMTTEASFEVLRRYSSHANVKLRDVAQLVVDHRLLPSRYIDLRTEQGPGQGRTEPGRTEPGTGPAGRDDAD